MDEAQFVTSALSNPINRAIVDRLSSAELPDAWLVSGALFQSCWNALCGRAPDYGIRDYDIFYFDPDTSWESEDAAIRRVSAMFADLAAQIEIRNQARVHLWYQKKFGVSYPALRRSTDGIDRFLMPCAQVGIRRRAAGYEVYAPHGFYDIAHMIIRPNPTNNFTAGRYYEKASRWQALWPELAILPARG